MVEYWLRKLVLKTSEKYRFLKKSKKFNPNGKSDTLFFGIFWTLGSLGTQGWVRIGNFVKKCENHCTLMNTQMWASILWLLRCYFWNATANLTALLRSDSAFSSSKSTSGWYGKLKHYQCTTYGLKHIDAKILKNYLWLCCNNLGEGGGVLAFTFLCFVPCLIFPKHFVLSLYRPTVS